MVARLPQTPDLQPLENNLLLQTNPLERIYVFEKLIEQCIFTDVERAQELLAELEQLLEKGAHPDQELRFHINQGLVYNQLYNYIAAADHFQIAVEEAELSASPEYLAEIYIDYAGILINNESSDEAERYLVKAEKILAKYKNPLHLARIACRRGFIYLKRNNYGIAVEYLIDAVKLINTQEQDLSFKDCYFLILTYGGLGDIHSHNEEYEDSIKRLHEAIRIAEETGVESRLSWHYLLSGNAEMDLENIENAEAYYIYVLDMEEDRNTLSSANANANLGYCHLVYGNFDQALDLLKKGETIFESFSSDDGENAINIATWKAEAYAGLGNEKAARKHFMLAFDLASAKEDNKKLSNICKNFATFYANAGNFQKAYEFQLQHAKYSELFVDQIAKEKRWELEAKFNVEMERKEAEMLRLEASKLQLKALRAQMNPHFTYNALNGIQSHITSNDKTSATKYLAKFSMLMRKSLLYSDMEVISLEKELDFLKDFLFINKKLRFMDALDYEIQVDDDIEEDIIGVPSMIIQPYVENAIEHGIRPKNQGRILIRLFLKDEQTLLCVVEDDGVGVAASRASQLKEAKYQNHRSKGTSITQKRLQLLHNAGEQDVFVETNDILSEDGKVAGTRVEIQIPVVDILRG